MARFASLLAAVSLVGSLALVGCSGGADEDAESGTSDLTASLDESVTAAQRQTIVEKKATCPFAGTAVAIKKLFLFGTPDKPVARVTGPGSVAELGDTGGGDLGSRVLTFFARGNHHFLPGGGTVPENTFSLDFPGSQGAHPGHSFILTGDPKAQNSGHFNRIDFDRLVKPKPSVSYCPAPQPLSKLALGVDDRSGGHAEKIDGRWVVRRSELGKFIAENLVRDEPRSKVADFRTARLLGMDLEQVLATTVKLVGHHTREDEDQILQKLTAALGEDNLVGSAGEFGLLFAFLARSPNTVQAPIDWLGLVTEPAVAVDDLRIMFGADGQRRMPAGWDQWKKTSLDWLTSTLALSYSASKEYAAIHTGLSRCEP